MDSVYWFLHGKNFNEAIEKLKNTKNEDLISLVINERYNDFLSKYCNYKDNEKPFNKEISNGKRVPYMGWFWRPLDFYSKQIPIGFSDDGDNYVAFMAKNKWYYDERNLTESEFNQVMEIIDEAMRMNEGGGEINKIYENICKSLEKLYPFFQSFKFNGEI
jgi:hypothetical protein